MALFDELSSTFTCDIGKVIIMKQLTEFKNISKKERFEKGLTNNSLTYGEMVRDEG